jgi:hypothetical protein
MHARSPAADIPSAMIPGTSITMTSTSVWLRGALRLVRRRSVGVELRLLPVQPPRRIPDGKRVLQKDKSAPLDPIPIATQAPEGITIVARSGRTTIVAGPDTTQLRLACRIAYPTSGHADAQPDRPMSYRARAWLRLMDSPKDAPARGPKHLSRFYFRFPRRTGIAGLAVRPSSPRTTNATRPSCHYPDDQQVHD